MSCKPEYHGDIKYLPKGYTSVRYFEVEKVEDWSYKNALLKAKIDKETFLSQVEQFSVLKKVPMVIRKFANLLKIFYSGQDGERILQVEKAQVDVELNRLMLESKEHLVIQQSLDNSLDREMILSASESSSSSGATTSISKRRRDVCMLNDEANNGDLASETKRIRRMERFALLDKKRFWILNSGRAVEEILYAASLCANAPLKIRSLAIDFDCEATERLFFPREWEEICMKNDFKLPELPELTLSYLLAIRKAVISGHSVAQIPLPVDDTFTCSLIQRTVLTWEQLYKMQPSPFGIPDLSETFWSRNSWPLLLDLLHDVPRIFMIDGEKMGLESSRRKNHDRKLPEDRIIGRKKIGRKLDLIARDVVDRQEWLVVERMKMWDTLSRKYLKECNHDLFREMATICRNRLEESKDSTFKNEAQFFGVYTGDRGFTSFELRPAGDSCFVTLFKQHRKYDLPSTLGDFKTHIRGLAHLLKIRMCVKSTIQKYRPKQAENILLEDLESDDEWIYKSDPEEIGAHITLASSPLDSPKI